MKLIKTITMAAIAVAFTAGGASAKDWMEKVRIETGINITPVKVRSNGHVYTTTAKTHHRFNMELYARAKSGKRIARAEVGRPDVDILEYDPEFNRRFVGDLIGNGTKRTWTFDGKFHARLDQVAWKNNLDPRKECQLMLDKMLKQGHSRASIMSKSQYTRAYAIFGFTAAAAKPKVAEAGLNLKKINQYTSEKTTASYMVRVQCLPSANHGNQLYPQQDSGAHPSKPGKALNAALQASKIGLDISKITKDRRSIRRATLKKRPLSAQ